MNQIFAANTEYEILTPNGWEDFEGVFLNKSASKESRKISFNDGSFVTATNDHRFFSQKQEVRVLDLTIGDKLDSGNESKSIVAIEECVLEDTYEIFNAENHVIIANEINSHQCDEFAFVQPNIADEFWTSISPTLATGGRAILTSTPNSDEDTFATIWKDAEKKFDEYGNETTEGINGFHSFTCHWSEHPDRDEAWQKAETGRIGEERFRREYGCEFLVYDETLINSIKLASMEGKLPILNMGQTRWYKKPSAKYSYVVALDPSMGTGGNNAAIQIIEVPTYEQVGEWNHNTTAIPGQIRVLKDICKYISDECKSNGSNIFWSVENNSIGEAALIVINDFGEEGIPGIFMSEPMRKGHVRKFRKGFNTTHGTKISACSRMKTMIENDQLKINSKPFISELKNFIATGSSYKAKMDESDDLISAMMLALRIITVMKDWDPAIYNSFVQIEAEESYELPMPIFISSNY